MKDFKSVTH